jgi:dolichyl-phosphate-mannose--protein O-mannosyl transferase
LKLHLENTVHAGKEMINRNIHTLIHRFIYNREPVACGSIVRLRHTNTKSYLHSHNHKSPLSNQQEVSCYDGKDAGDDWKVECLEKGDKYWLREKPIQLVHQETHSYLSSFQQHQFGQPIPGQLEVACAKGASKNSVWMAQVIVVVYYVMFLFIERFFFYTNNRKGFTLHLQSKK